jgi:hypothetical protein
VTTDDTEAFAQRIVHSGHAVEAESQTKSFVVEIRRPELRLPNTPEHWSVVVHGGAGVSHLIIRPTGAAPKRLTVDGWPALRALTLDGAPAPNAGFAGAIELNLLATGDPLTFDSTGWVYADLTIRDGRVEFSRSVNPLALTLVNGGISKPVMVTSILILKGHVELPRGMSAANTSLDGVVRITDYPGATKAKPVLLGDVIADTYKNPELQIGLAISCDSLPGGLRVELDTGAIEVKKALVCTFTGRGQVRVVNGHDLRFEDAINLTLTLAPGDWVDGASGVVNQLNISHATLTGATEDPLAVHVVEEAEGAQIQDVDLSHLVSISSVEALRKAHRVSPYMPTRFPALERLAEGRPRSLTTSARQVFWAQLADVVSEKRARGAVQSSARFVAAHARWNDAPRNSRERVWLSAYRWVGYGESILRPLAIHAALTTLVFVLVILGVGSMEPGSVINDVSDALGYWWSLFVSPISFFLRDPQVSLIKGAWLAQLLTTTIRIEGVLMLFFSLAAIRRLTKAE